MQLAGVGFQPVARLTSEKLVARHTERLALNIPERCVYPTQPGEYVRVGGLSPEATAIDILPQCLAPEGIGADEKAFRDLLRRVGARLVADAIGQADLTHTGQPFVRVHTHQHRMPRDRDFQRHLDVEDFDLGDFH